MTRTRIILLGASVLLILLLFQLPKAVVENEAEVAGGEPDSISSHIQVHAETPAELQEKIRQFRARLAQSAEQEKNAIFADSLAGLYETANLFDSAAWFSEEASRYRNTAESWERTADYYYQAYSLAIDQARQASFASKAQEYYGKVLEAQPDNLEAKTKMAMTYLSSPNPMQGISMLREVLARDPQNQLALFNMGMLSIQSGQYERAIERLQELVRINPAHIQGNLLLGVAWMNAGNKEKAREQLNRVKQMDQDPAVQATVDSYLKDLE